jgi:hypothetical protein
MALCYFGHRAQFEHHVLHRIYTFYVLHRSYIMKYEYLVQCNVYVKYSVK